MSFLHPEFLYLMLPALTILFFFLISGEEEHNKYFSQEVLQKLQVHSNTLTMRARNALFFIMFALIIIALAQPVIEDGKVKVKAKSSDIMVALDISDSMLAQDVYPTRLEAAKKKVLDLLKSSPQERIGVMAFAKDAYLVSPLSFDHRAVRFLLKQVSTGSITGKGTDFIRLLTSAKGALSEDDNRYLLILTDGADKQDFSEEIALAKKEGIRIFILGVGTPQGAPIKLKDGLFIKQHDKIIVSKLNSAIKELALQTGGAYIESVTSSDDIKAMLREIQAKTEKRELKEEEVTLYIALFYYPLGLAMFLFLIATSSMSKRERLVMPHAFVLLLLGLHVSDAQAGLLDFQMLENAKTSYESEDFNKSSKLYGEYLQSHNTPQSHYNLANADYQRGNYKAAAVGYEQVHSKDKELEFKALHNLGNSCYMQGDLESLKKAVESYKKALKIHDDSDTKDNMKKAQKKLEKIKKEEQYKDDKNGDKNLKKDKNGDKKKSEKDKNGDQKEKDQKNQDQKDGEKQEDKKSKSDEQKDKGKKESNQNKEQKDKEQEKRKEQEKASQKSEEKKKEQAKQAQAAQQEDPEKMSEREAQKWLKMLNAKPREHLYQLNNEQRKKRDENEKPW